MSFSICCADCGAKQDPYVFATRCPDCGGMVDATYDIGSVALSDSTNPYERFADLLPIRNRSALPTDAAITPVVHAKALGERLGLSRLYLKNETTLPTGTTKDRMAAVALAYLHERGVREFCTSSTGNSSTAYGHAISRFPDMKMHIFTAADFAHRLDIPDIDNINSVVIEGATFVEAFEAARHYATDHNLVSEGGFFNPGRREGLKLAFLEAVDQVPTTIDWYVQATSSAMGVYGTARAAQQLNDLGHTTRTPKLACVQQARCAPMVSAWEAGRQHIVENDIVAQPRGLAEAILRGDPTATYPIMADLVAASDGAMVAVDDDAIIGTRRLVEELEGIWPCHAASAAVAGAAELARRGAVGPDETVLVNITGSDRQR